MQIANGKVTCSSKNNLKSTCSYECDYGFALIGSSQTICEGLGKPDWSNKPPICKCKFFFYCNKFYQVNTF